MKTVDRLAQTYHRTHELADAHAIMVRRELDDFINDLVTGMAIKENYIMRAREGCGGDPGREHR